MSISDENYAQVQQQVLMFGALVRSVELGAFIERAQQALDRGALHNTPQWIAGHKKLELLVELAKKLRVFQAALPTEEQAREIDMQAELLRARLGV